MRTRLGLGLAGSLVSLQSCAGLEGVVAAMAIYSTLSPPPTPLPPSTQNVNVPISSATTMNLNQVGMQDLIGASPDWGHFYSFVIFLFFNPDNPVYN